VERVHACGSEGGEVKHLWVLNIRTGSFRCRECSVTITGVQMLGLPRVPGCPAEQVQFSSTTPLRRGGRQRASGWEWGELGFK